jgi:hypothetical protein
VIVLEALPDEADAVGALRVEAYQAQDLLAASPGYADTLRILGFGGRGAALVAFARFAGAWETSYPAIIKLWEAAWAEFVSRLWPMATRFSALPSAWQDRYEQMFD